VVSKMRMKKTITIVFLLAASAACSGIEDLDFTEMATAGLEWFEENVPESLHARIGEVDWEYYTEKLLGHLQEYSWEDMAGCEEQAQTLLAFLNQYERLEPLAVWLETRVDYFAMADEFLQQLRELPPEPEVRPRPVPGPAPLPPPAPRRRPVYPPQKKWEAKLKTRPKPARADGMVPELKTIFEREGVPGEWVWIAEVESSFNPSARSPAGAAGLFQFMPATARRFGLKTSPQDERLDPRKSAAAAARYLGVLHRRFDSWPLALAAYNAGEGRVGGLLKKHGAGDFDGIAEKLPLETRLYVPKVLATVSLREGVNAEHLPPPS